MCFWFFQEAVVELDLAQPLGMKLTKSGLVHFVTAGGQFESAGIRKGDQVVGIGQIRCRSSEEFAATLKLYKAAGGPVAIVFTEGQKRKSAASDSGAPRAKVVVEANEPVAAAPRERMKHRPRARAAPRNRSRSPGGSTAGSVAAAESQADPLGTSIKNL